MGDCPTGDCSSSFAPHPPPPVFIPPPPTISAPPPRWRSRNRYSPWAPQTYQGGLQGRRGRRVSGTGCAILMFILFVIVILAVGIPLLTNFVKQKDAPGPSFAKPQPTHYFPPQGVFHQTSNTNYRALTDESNEGPAECVMNTKQRGDEVAGGGGTTTMPRKISALFWGDENEDLLNKLKSGAGHAFRPSLFIMLLLVFVVAIIN